MMVEVRKAFPQFFTTQFIEDIPDVDTFVVDGSTMLRQRLPGLAKGGSSADAIIASRCGLPTEVKLRDVGWLLFSFVKTLLQEDTREDMTVVLGLDSAVPFPARAITRIGRVASSDTHIEDVDQRIKEVQQHVNALYHALLNDARRTHWAQMLDVEIHADCLKLIAYDGTKSIFQQLVLLCTVAVAVISGVRGRLFVLGLQRHELYDLDEDPQDIIAMYGWGTVDGNVLTLSNTHPWCTETGLLQSHCKKSASNKYVVSESVLDLLVFQEAQYQAVKIHGREVDLHVRGVDTSLEKDFLGVLPCKRKTVTHIRQTGASIFGPGNFAVRNNIKPSTSLWFGGGDVDCFSSAVLLSLVGGWPEGLKVSTTTMYKYSRTKQFEIVTDLKQLSYGALPYLLGFNGGCDYCLGFFGYAHRSFLKLSLLNRINISEGRQNDRYTLTMSYNDDPIVVLQNTSEETAGVRVCEQGYYAYMRDVINQRTAANTPVTDRSIEVARRRFEWFLGALIVVALCVSLN